MVSYCSGSIVCEKVNLADMEGQPNNICYSEGSTQIKCPRNYTLLIPALLQRVHGPGESEDPSSCSTLFRDSLYDIGRCLLKTSDVQEKTTYEAAVREVLKECSQKRYCILESDKTSSIHGLRDLPVGEANILSSHLVVIHQCVKDQIVLCESKTQTDNEIYISINWLRMSALGTSTCTCTVSGAASHVTLLDVRLGNNNRTGLSISDKTGSVYTAHGGHQTVHYMKEIRMSQTEWRLHLEVIQDHVPDKIWMRVQGYNSTKVTVTCEGDQDSRVPGPEKVRITEGHTALSWASHVSSKKANIAQANRGGGLRAWTLDLAVCLYVKKNQDTLRGLYNGGPKVDPKRPPVNLTFAPLGVREEEPPPPLWVRVRGSGCGRYMLGEP
ncbi:uncharacterized protein [Haliotis asinina]|uniref:uncharacterized protein n=1 Tax=Haliotis asinina TaxID=109174 RepID=UPI003531EC0E